MLVNVTDNGPHPLAGVLVKFAWAVVTVVNGISILSGLQPYWLVVTNLMVTVTPGLIIV